jgi:hypothetical protein
MDGMSLLILILITNWLDFKALELVVMDRTNWDRGKQKYNFLSIGLMGRKKFSVKVFHRYMRGRKQSQMEMVLENGSIIHLVVVENENKAQKNAEPYVFLLTNLSEPSQAPAIYRRCYRIEPCYKHLKSNGFQLEQLNLKGQHKTDLIFSMLTLIYTMAVVQGLWKNEQQPVQQKVLNQEKSPEISTFLKGLIALKEAIYNLQTFFEVLKSLLKGAFKLNYNP